MSRNKLQSSGLKLEFSYFSLLARKMESRVFIYLAMYFFIVYLYW